MAHVVHIEIGLHVGPETPLGHLLPHEAQQSIPARVVDDSIVALSPSGRSSVELSIPVLQHTSQPGSPRGPESPAGPHERKK